MPYSLHIDEFSLDKQIKQEEHVNHYEHFEHVFFASDVVILELRFDVQIKYVRMA